MILIRHGADVPRLVPTSGCWAGPVVSRWHTLVADSPVTFSQWAWGQSLPSEVQWKQTLKEPGSGPGTPLGSLESSICATAQDLNKNLLHDKHSSQMETMKLKAHLFTVCFLTYSMYVIFFIFMYYISIILDFLHVCNICIYYYIFCISNYRFIFKNVFYFIQSAYTFIFILPLTLYNMAQCWNSCTVTVAYVYCNTQFSIFSFIPHHLSFITLF